MLNFKVNAKSILLIFTVIIACYYLIGIAIAPGYTMQSYRELVEADSGFIQKLDSNYEHPIIAGLLKELAYKEALLQLSKSDSIQMVVNLSDCTIALSLHGVIIHQTKLTDYKKDKLLLRLPSKQSLKLFSEPLQVQSHIATIVKEPIVERQAPKDAVEAALNAWKPDTLIQNPAYAIFSLDYAIRLIIEQDKHELKHEVKMRRIFYRQIFFTDLKATFLHFFKGKHQDYFPTLTLKIPVNDLRAIYRALPENTLVVINM